MAQALVAKLRRIAGGPGIITVGSKAAKQEFADMNEPRAVAFIEDTKGTGAFTSSSLFGVAWARHCFFGMVMFFGVKLLAQQLFCCTFSVLVNSFINLLHMCSLLCLLRWYTLLTVATSQTIVFSIDWHAGSIRTSCLVW
jgi:hypothetical protein